MPILTISEETAAEQLKAPERGPADARLAHGDAEALGPQGRLRERGERDAAARRGRQGLRHGRARSPTSCARSSRPTKSRPSSEAAPPSRPGSCGVDCMSMPERRFVSPWRLLRRSAAAARRPDRRSERREDRGEGRPRPRERAAAARRSSTTCGRSCTRRRASSRRPSGSSRRPSSWIPTDGALRREYGELLRDLPVYPEAEKEARKAVELEPKSAGAHRLLGQVLLATAKDKRHASKRPPPSSRRRTSSRPPIRREPSRTRRSSSGSRSRRRRRSVLEGVLDRANGPAVLLLYGETLERSGQLPAGRGGLQGAPEARSGEPRGSPGPPPRVRPRPPVRQGGAHSSGAS